LLTMLTNTTHRNISKFRRRRRRRRKRWSSWKRSCHNNNLFRGVLHH
jgi:hypothetical protein